MKNSLTTGLPVNADNVTGVINSFPAGVITICTSAPAFISKRASEAALYAAMLPVIPNTICLSFKVISFVLFLETKIRFLNNK